MKRFLFISIFCLISIDILCAQDKRECLIPIHLNDFGVILGQITQSDTIIKLSNNHYIKVHFFSCDGDLFIQECDSNYNIVIEGTYCKSLDTLSGYKLITDPNNPYNSETIIAKYFVPLKSGIWIFKTLKGNIIREEKWYKGVLQNQF